MKKKSLVGSTPGQGQLWHEVKQKNLAKSGKTGSFINDVTNPLVRLMGCFFQYYLPLKGNVSWTCPSTTKTDPI